MRSRSNSLEDVTKAKLALQQQQQTDTRKRSVEREEPSGRAERRSRHREPPDDTGTIQRNHKTAKNNTCASGSGSGSGSSSASGTAKGGRREKGRDLSRDDLVFLLSLLEGELQVIQTAEMTELWEHLAMGRQARRHGTGPSRTYSQTMRLSGQWALKMD